MKKLHKLLILLTVTILLSTSLMAQMTLKFITANANEDITLPLHGTVSVTVDWGDGNSNTYTSAANRTHTYSSAGTHTVNISAYNSANPALTQYGNVVTYSNVDKLTEVTSFGSLGITSLNGAFRGATKLTVVPTSLPSGVTDVRNMFYGASRFNDDISAWDVSNVTNMGAMFYGALTFNQDISGWNVSNVTNMGAMFRLAKAFDQDISNWERTTPPTSSLSNVTNMGGMFQSAIVFNQNIGNWDVSAVTNMAWMFFNAAIFDGDIGNWDVSEVTSMAAMLGDAKKFNQPLGSWNISKVTDMTSMFYQAEAFNKDISTWERTNPPATSASSLNDVLKMKNMFNGAKVFNQNIGNWDVSLVNDMKNMFYGATAFNQDLGGWDVSLVTDMTDMFNGVTLSKTNYDALLIGWKNRTLTADVVFSAGSSVCSPGAAAEARQYIIDTYGWVFTDGGIDPLTWDGSTDSDWNDATNWDYATLPISTYDVIIANVTNDPVINKDPATPATCNNLTMSSDAVLVINAGKALTVSGNLTVASSKGAATLTVESTSATSTGSLIVEGTATGDVTVERFLTHDRWHYIAGQTNISSTFTGVMGLGTPGSSSNQFYRWDESFVNVTTGFWIDILNGPTGNGTGHEMGNSFISCKGYAINYITNDKTLSLSGVPYVADQSINITRTATSTNEGANLIGNPFTSTIALNTNADGTNNFIDQNADAMDDSYENVYLWNEQGNWSYPGNDYLVISNSEGATFAAPGQAFMVVAASHNATINFNKTIQKHGAATFYKNNGKDEVPRFYMNVENNEGLYNEILIAFIEGMTNGLNPSYDAGKLKGNPNIALYTKLVEDSGIDFAHQALPPLDDEVVRVKTGLDVSTAGNYTFKIKELQNFDEAISIKLEDKLTGSLIDFRQDGEYSFFINTPGEIRERFVLHFNGVTGIEDDEPFTEATIQTYASNNTLYILNPKMKRGTVTIYNLTGQKAATFELTGDTKQQQILNMINIINIVKIQTGNGVLSQKVIFK